MKEALKRLGLNEMDEDKDGCYWQSYEAFLWGGILGFCCCGNPDAGLAEIKEVLEAIEHGTLQDKYLLHYYVLDKEHLTAHGTSVYGSWLTQKGKDFLTVLRSIEL